MKKGFSLVEIVVTMAILIVIIGTISLITMNSSKSFANASVQASMQNDAVTINQIYQNEIRNSTAVTILENRPETFDENLQYIYIDEEQSELMVKSIGKDPVAIHLSDNEEQTVLFKKIDEKSISVELTLNMNDEKFSVTTNTTFENMSEKAEVVDETENGGTCLAYEYEGLFLKQFIFTKTLNEGMTSDAVGIIDEENKTVKITVDTSDVTNLKPNISIFGKDVCFDNRLEPKYDISNPKPLDFTNPRKIFVFGEDGSYKEYLITVEVVVEDSDIEGFSVIPLKNKNDDPTDEDKVTMPTESAFLYAQFDETGDYKNYTINWYSVDALPKIHQSSDQWQYIASTKERTLDLSKYKEKTLGKFVFFEVQAKSGSGLPNAYSIAQEYLNDKQKYTPYVYVQLDYGNLWETTLNEIDYMSDRTIELQGPDFQETMIPTYGDKVEAIENAYSKAPTFRKEYQKYDSTGFTLIGEWSPNKNKFSGHIKSIIMDSTDFTYRVDYLKKDLRIQGNRQGGLAGYPRKTYPILRAYRPYNYPNLATGYGSDMLPTTHYSILSVNRYHNYYKDKSTDTDWSTPYTQNNGVRVGIVNTRVLGWGMNYPGGYSVQRDPSYKNDAPYFNNFGELGGFAISPNSTVRVDGSDKRLYSTGYFYEFNFYPYRLWPVTEVPGVNMYDFNDSIPTNNYLNRNNSTNTLKAPAIGAHTSKTDYYYYYYTPYYVQDISNLPSFEIAQYDMYYTNFTIDFFTKRKTNKIPIVEVDMYRGTNIKDESELQSRKSKTMFFGDFREYEGTNPNVDKVNNTYRSSSTNLVYGANEGNTVTTETAIGKDHIVMMDYNNKMNQSSRRNVTITAWAPTVNHEYGPLSYGNLDFIITEISTLNTPR